VSSVQKRVNRLKQEWERRQKFKTLVIPEDPVVFFETFLKLKPTPYQAEWLRDPAFFKVNNWCRRAGKTTVFAGDDIHFACLNPGAPILCIMPKWTQLKEVYFGALHEHLAHIDKEIYEALIFDELQTIIRFRNRAKILGETPEPFTIRGHGPRKISLSEMNFIRKDKDLWLSALLPMTLTQKVKISVDSTPWNKDSIYWKMLYDKTFRIFSGNIYHEGETAEGKPFHELSKYHKKWDQVLKPNGTLDPNQVEVMREQYAGDPWRWRREAEALFADDETAFLPSSLIIKCQNEDLEFAKFEENINGNFSIGWDLGRERDYGVVSVIDKREDVLVLVHCKQFPLGTPYIAQMGYIKSICDRWRSVNSVYYDHTGTKGMDEEISRACFPRLVGVDFSKPVKHGLASALKQKMMSVRESDRMLAPEEARRQFELPFDMDVQAELNVVQWEQTPGSEVYTFSHQEGTHDDRFWSIALAVSAAIGTEPQAKLVRAY
jgi:phage FluMu gp28-like protein